MLTKILIIRFSSIGDIVLTTPVVRCLKQQLTGEVELHYLVKEQYAPLLKANPYISKIHILRKSTDEVIAPLRNENFDYVIDLQNNLRSLYVKRQLGRLSFTVNKINIRKWLKVNFKLNVLPNVHIVDRYIDTIKAFGIENDGKGLDYFIPSEEEVSLAVLPETHRKGYVAFVIGGKYTTKKLPVQKIVSICQKINKPIVLFGGKEDFETAELIIKEFQTGNRQLSVRSQPYNSCGRFTINQSASMVNQASKVITHDTGLMHIAAALKKPVISIWGNTIPEFGMYPYYGELQIKDCKFQIANLPCRPCTKLGFSKCPEKHFKCMNLINETEVAEAANSQ